MAAVSGGCTATTLTRTVDPGRRVVARRRPTVEARHRGGGHHAAQNQTWLRACRPLGRGLLVYRRGPSVGWRTMKNVWLRRSDAWFGAYACLTLHQLIAVFAQESRIDSKHLDTNPVLTQWLDPSVSTTPRPSPPNSESLSFCLSLCITERSSYLA